MRPNSRFPYLIWVAAAAVGGLLGSPAGDLLDAKAAEPSSSRYGPGGIYARIPATDEFGRDQLAMFRVWNPDPVALHDANLAALNPLLARVIRKAEADNPDLRFVIGSGRREPSLQRKAMAWGWSKTPDSPHQTGDAVDLWPIDEEGRVYFDPRTQNAIGSAMMKAARALDVALLWGGHFQSFKNRDRSHFELAHLD